MIVNNHKKVSKYDGSFKCLHCGARWGALPGHPKMPELCDKRTDVVTLEEIESIQKRRAEINGYDLNNIRFTLKGELLNIDDSIRNEFNFTGLNNIDFITSGYYRKN